MEYTKVRLIGVTEPKIEGVTSAEELVAYAARVSNPTNQHNSETAPKLLKYLLNNKHWSPFEMVSVILEIETTRDIGRQILRHRSFSFQEFSQRYATVDQLGFITREARLQDAKNRQASNDTDNDDLKKEWNARQLALLDHAAGVYKWALGSGIAKEQARAALPEGLTMSRMYMAGTLRSWIHFISTRTDIGTQKEHREIALKCKAIIEEQFPSISQLL